MSFDRDTIGAMALGDVLEVPGLLLALEPDEPVLFSLFEVRKAKVYSFNISYMNVRLGVAKVTFGKGDIGKLEVS